MIDRTARLPLWLFFPLASALAATACSVSAPTNDTETSGSGRGSRLTLERLYSLPRLIGTPPRGPVWSADGRKVAFLWNDAGANFYDIWTMERDKPSPVRLSTFERPAAPGDSLDPDARRKAVASEQAPGVGFVLWFPDGAHLLAGFRGDLYALDPAGTVTRLTETGGAESRAAFSPDGRRLACVLDGDIRVHDVQDGRLGGGRQLTRIGGDGIGVESFRWSPRGDAIAFVETDRRGIPERIFPDYLTDETSVNRARRPVTGEPSEKRRLLVLSLDAAAEPRAITLGDDLQDLIVGYDWSPDGQKLLVDKSDLYVKDRRLLLADPAAGSTTELVREVSPENVTAQWWADWAPDGQSVYFVSDRDEDYHLYRVSTAGGAPTRMTSGNWTVTDATVTPDGIVFVANDGKPEERHVFKVPLQGGAPTRLSVRPGTHSPVVSPDARFAAVLFSSDTTPPDLLLTRFDGPRDGPDAERQVTSSPLPEFGNYRWVQPRYVTFANHKDGVTLHGRLLLPPDFDAKRKYPAILGSVYSNTVRNQWGGRNAHPTWGLDQYLLQEGFVILQVDVRGSSGHGRAFRRGIRLDYGGIDVEDLYSGVLYLRQQGFVDEGRVGIWGSSYGGLMTCMSLFTKPGVYKAGVAGAPATNVFHANTGEMRVMMRPQDQQAEYADASAYTKAAGLQDHLMIIHGMRDRTVLFKDSVVLVERLMLLGKDVDFVVAPNSEHGWDAEGLYQTLFTYRKLVGHFERYLGKGPTPVS